MRVVVLAALVIAATAAPSLLLAKDVHVQAEDSMVRHEFTAWHAQHSKSYTGEEFESRFAIYQDNRAFVQEHNAKKLSYWLAINEFSDLTHEEFKTTHLGAAPGQSMLRENHGDTPFRYADSATNDAGVDWRTKGAVSPVKNQQQCGSCWAFSTIVSIEGAHAKAKGDLVKLSEQNLVDCVKGQKDPANGQTCCMGCRGGLMNDAMQYIIDKQDGGVDTELSYKYKGVGESTCHFTEDAVGATISSFTQVTSGDEYALKQAVATVGPVSIGVDASTGWQLYRGGVLHPKSSVKGFHPFKKKGGCSSSPTKMDHGVAVVGYGTDDTGGDYWIVRNSWGPGWGENGYIRLARGVNACGIANAAVYPTAN